MSTTTIFILLFIVSLLVTATGAWIQTHQKCPSCKKWTKTRHAYCPHCGSSRQVASLSSLRGKNSDRRMSSARTTPSIPRNTKRSYPTPLTTTSRPVRATRVIDEDLFSLSPRTIKRAVPKEPPPQGTPSTPSLLWSRSLSHLRRTSVSCPSCHTSADTMDDFCGNCGTALRHYDAI